MGTLQDVGTGGKGKGKASVPTSGVFEDSEGVWLPPQLNSEDLEWKRLIEEEVSAQQQYWYPLVPQTPVVVEDEAAVMIDLISCNKHLLHSEVWGHQLT